VKTLRCRDAGFDCDFEIRAQTVEEVLRLAAQHLSEVHQVEVKAELAQQVDQLIRDEPDGDDHQQTRKQPTKKVGVDGERRPCTRQASHDASSGDEQCCPPVDAASLRVHIRAHHGRRNDDRQ